jgi:hypothetical protein
MTRALGGRPAHIAQAMIWVPAEVGEVRRQLHEAGLTPAVLVPVDRGTAVVATAVTTTREARQWAGICEKAGGAAVTLAWAHDGNSYLVGVSGAHGLSEAMIEPFLRTGTDNAAQLLDVARKPGAAHVTRLVSTRALDKWLKPASAIKPTLFLVAAVVVGLGLAIAVLVLRLSPIFMAPVAMGFALFVLWRQRRSVSHRPIDEVLPVVPLSELSS